MQEPLVANEVDLDVADDPVRNGVNDMLPSNNYSNLDDDRTYIVSSVQHGVYSGFTSNYGSVPSGAVTQPRAGVWTRKQVFGIDENVERGNWTGRFEYLLSMLGYAVGLGNVWRFPYLCYDHGGGAFLVPYLLFMTFVGIPLFFLESSLGQFTSTGPTTCWDFAPLLQGIGIAMMISSFIISTYYCMIIAWCHFYLFASFTATLPWADCEGYWTTEDCSLKLPDVSCDMINHTQHRNGTCYHGNSFVGLWNYDLFKNVTGREREAPTKQYWENYVLGLSGGIEETGAVFTVLMDTSVLVSHQGNQVCRKVFPYIVLLILFFRGVTLEGAGEGIKYYITPKFYMLKDIAIWRAAAVQIFYSLGTCGGGIVALSSYNRFHNNILRDSLIVSLSNCMTSVFAGFVIFSYVGHMANQLKVSVDHVADDGPGLAFVIYPEAVQNLPGPTFWSIMFFFMLVTLGLDSQFASVEALLTSVLDSFPRQRKWKTLLIFIICVVLFLLGLPFTTKSGIYWVTLIDYYAAAWGVLLTGLFEVIAIAYIYGVDRFCSDIEAMIGPWSKLYWKVCWLCITPLGTACILLLSWIEYEAVTYNEYKYPSWAEGLGWLVSFIAITSVPIVILYKIVMNYRGKSIMQTVKSQLVPTRDWGPALVKHRQLIQHVAGFVVDPKTRGTSTEIPYNNLSNMNHAHINGVTNRVMGIISKHGLNVLVLLLPYLILATASDDHRWRGKYDESQNTEWKNNEWNIPDKVNELRCCIQACMIGPFCNESVANYTPQFKSGYTFAEITKDGIGQRVEYNSTTYPTPNGCVCDNIVYTLVSIYNDIEHETENGVFAIDRYTGEITLQKEMGHTEMYSLLVEARNVRTNISTETKVTVARRFTPKSNWMDAFEPIQQMGYEEPHHRQKRSTPGDQINFALTKLDNINSTKVGHKVDFQLVIDFPPSAVIDMLIEIFAPDNDTTVMILCDVSFSHDPQITTSNNPAQIQLDSKDGNNVTLPDRAIIDFGDVTNNDGANTRQITVLYSAVMVKNTATIDAATYWVSIGADFDNENYLWVGQASFTADYDTTAAVQPLFFVDAPNDVESGSSHNIAVQMQLPYPHSTYNFRVYAPADAPGTMSVCSVQYQGHGTNYGCGNDFTAVSTTLTADPTGPGNSVGLVSLGQLLNAGSRDANPLTDASNISLSFIAHVYPSLSAGSLASLALSLEVDTNILWVGNLSMNVLTKTATPVSPTITSTNVDFFGGAAGTVGQPFSITYNIDVPIPSVPGAGYNYVLQVLAPFTTEALFSVCSLEIMSVGQDLPCIKTDDLVPVYTSRDPSGTLPDTATLDLGSVTNVNLHSDGVLVVKATLSPIEGKVTAPTSETVYFGATVDSTYIALHNESINIQNSATSIVVTNATAPTFNMDYWDSTTDVRINGVTRLDIDMMTGSNTTYQPLELEFLMPTDGSRSYMHICKVEVSSRGRNLPCLTPEWSNKIMEYISTYSNDEYDRARLSLQRLCNTAEFVDTAENRAVFSVYLKVLDLDSLVDNTQKWVSAGLIYSTTKLWIGQIDMMTRTAAGLAIPQPSQYVHTHFQQNSTAGGIEIGESAQYSLLVKLPKNETVDLKIQVNSSAQGLDICTVRVFASGDNVPCTEDELTTKSYTYHADDGRASAFLDVGVIKKFTLDDTSINNFFDMDSLIIEVIVTGSAAGSYTFDLEIFLDTAMNTANSIKYSNYNVTVLSTTQTQTYADVVNMTIAVGEFVTNDTIDSNWAIGEVKRMLLDAYVPENFNYQLDFSVIIPSTYVGKLEVLDAALFSVGSNLPCIDLEKTVAVITGTGTYNDTAQFNLGHICSWPLKPGVATENRIVFEVFIRALPNGAVAAGETVEIDGTMTVNGGSPISITSTTLTITNMDSFVDKVESFDGVTNSTVIELDQSSPIIMTISQNITIGVLITITPNSQSRFLFDVQTPLSDSACLTIWDMRVIGTQGRNVLDIGPSITKGLEFTPQYNSTLGNGQQDYGFIDLGIITNTGLTHRLKSNATDDDKFKIEVDVQMADCAASAHGATLTLSFGEKLLNVIIVYDHPVQISRDNQEKPDIVFDVLQTVISSNLYIDAVVYHSNESTAETYNMSVLAYLPSYQVAPTSLTSNNLDDKCSLVSTDSLVVEISCTTFFFNDTLTFRAIAGVNNSVELAQGYSSSDSGTFYEITADFNYRSDYYNITDPQDWFPTYTSSPNSLAYSVSAGIGTGCVSALGMEFGAIQNCQITGSLNGLTDIFLARLNALGGAWRPFIRAGDISKMRYVQVYFGNVVKVTQIAVQQNGNAIATSIAVEHSHDGIAWYGREEINLAGSALETVSVPGGESAEYIRIYVGNTTVPAHPDVSLRFELYGCTISGTMSQADICSSAPTSPTVTSDFYPRSFLVDPSGKIIVCDRAVSSDYIGRCRTSPDGNSWQAVAENVATVIGLETTKLYIYAYAQDLETILRSEDGAITWIAVESDQLTTDKNSGSWQGAKEVPETLDGNLVQGTPHTSYTQGNWGATYDGIFLSGVERLKWTST